jgi:ribonuclease-3
MQNLFQILENRLSYQFNDPNLLQCALTHSSLSAQEIDNQRLEFLGDAILGLLVAEKLYQDYPDDDEGALDHMRAGLVNGKTLALVAKELEIGAALQMSEAHRLHRPEPSQAMLEDALEAVIGAIYLDGGLEAVRPVVTKIFAAGFANAANFREGNPKSRLQEWSQKNHQGAIPIYLEVDCVSPGHAKRFQSSVTLNGKELGTGFGSSKKIAECAAAEAALKLLQL